MPRQGILAALFDMDGVIVDNMAFHQKAWELFFDKYRPPMALEEFMLQFGRTNKDLFEVLFGRKISPEEEESFGEEKEALYREAYAPHVEAVPGFMEFVAELKAQGVRTAVATSAPRINLEFVLERLPISAYLDVLADSSWVTRGKPDPEIYLKTAAALECPPAACVVFEDSYAGIRSGQNAGMRVVALATTHPPERLSPYAPDRIIRDFTEMDYAAFISL
ncbi:MAG: HAD family hydrolase [Candidatus Aminicenantaceae bacterium]